MTSPAKQLGPSEIFPDTGKENPGASGDLTGRDRMLRNVLTSWGGHLVFIVAGFIMPRMIDHKMGQEALGVWDFAWSLIAYFSLVQIGIVSSVNRHVAIQRSKGDMDGVNRVVSSVTVVLILMATVVVVLSLGAALATPALFQERLGEFTRDSQWIIVLLGASLAVQVAFSAFGGVLTGYHHWGAHNLIFAGKHAACVAGMIVALLLGVGLVGLAAVILAAEFVGWLVRVSVAYRLCPGLRVRASLARWETTRSMLGFGGKAFVLRMSELLANQTTAVLIVGYLGPAALALFARPMALVRHVRVIVAKFAMVLIPMSSSLQAGDSVGKLRDFLTSATRVGVCVALPAMLTLTILGKPLLHAWMGPNYARGDVVAVLALGHLAFICYIPAQYVLTGLNAHGMPGLVHLIASLCSVGLVVVALATGHGLIGAALALCVPLTVFAALFVPAYACKRLGLPLSRYLARSLLTPVLCSVPFAVCLVVARDLFPNSISRCLASAAGSGMLVLGVLYWRFVLPRSLRTKVLMRLRFARTAGEPTGGT